MIEKMRFLSITGPKDDIDRVVDVYLGKYDMHLENALSELASVHDLMPFVDINPYKDALNKSADLVKKLNPDCVPSQRNMTSDEASEVITKAFSIVADLDEKKKALKDQKAHLSDLLHQIEPFRLLNYNIKTILDFKFIKFRFGRISNEYYNKFSKYAYDNLNTIFYECGNDRDYVWGIYFVPASQSVKVDAIYSSLHFDRIIIPNEYDGTPEESYQAMAAKMKEISGQIKEISLQIKKRLEEVSGDLLLANSVLTNVENNHNVRKLAACTKSKGDKKVFYILCGWMPVKEADSFLKEIKDDPDIYCISEDDEGEIEGLFSKPPTKLKNPKIFKPFEMFIKMYGLPAYNEIDPTIFVALTYSLLFGIMFGDVGQGACLLIGGFLLYKIKKMNLASIISCAGIFSTIFGFMYGSVFGFEDWIPHVWLKPMDNVMTVLLTTVAFGVLLIVIAMIMNIINGIKAHDVEKIWFDTNGVAGLVFYAAAIICAVLIATGHTLPGITVLILFFGLPLLLMFFKEPLTHLVQKKKKVFPDNKVMFFVESLFELFEVLLSYVTNTISFLRVGAFALSHAAMMGVVLMLSGVESGNPNILVIVLGNILVACMEGLIVGIQVLRLEYYEMFSRFYKGTGKEFKSFKNN